MCGNGNSKVYIYINLHISTVIKMKNTTTTIRLRFETKELLDKAKIIPEEPYDRVIVRALEALKKA